MENMETIIEEKKNYRFKIDYAKWKNDLDDLLAQRENDRKCTPKKEWACLDTYYDPKLTKLYSILAQSRGRIHRAFARLNYDEWRKLPSSKINPVKYDLFVQNDGAVKLPLTLDDQATYIDNDWKQYAQTE